MRLLQLYYNSFSGLRKEVWWLALVTLINRAGTMVIPFLSLYLTAHLGYTLAEVGWIMTAFGLGSVCGAWLGGKLTDKIGFYNLMFWSLFISGIMFVNLQFIQSFWGLCVAVFLLLLVSDTFRPAVFVAIAAYSKPENRTRSITLIRLAINLGFSFGPAVGGLIITTMGYAGLFWIDGLTCIIAGVLFVYLLQRKEPRQETTADNAVIKLSPYHDKHYLLFLVALLLTGFAFLQLFSTLPLYYRDVHHLSEKHIGWLIALNGLIIFLAEMPLVKYFEQDRFSIFRILIGSTLLFALSFFVLNLSNWVGILAVGMLLLTVGEMLNFPFCNAFALSRAQEGNQGAYMALFTMTFSLAHIFGHNSGLQLIGHFGYEVTWYIMTGMLVIASLILWRLKAISKGY